MCRSSIWKGLIARAMAAVMVVLSMPLGVAHAGMVTTDRVIDQVAAQDDRARVLDFLARDDVRRQIESLGIDPEEAATRAAGLSDIEIAQIAGQLDELPAGQGFGEFVALILVIFLVLLVTDILGMTNVFPFIR